MLGVPFSVPMNAKQLYWDARESYINGNYLSTIIVIGSAIEATIIGKIDPMVFNAKDIDTTRLCGDIMVFELKRKIKYVKKSLCAGFYACEQTKMRLNSPLSLREVS